MDYAATMRSAYERINEGDIEGFGDIMKFDDAGSVREHWGVADMMSMMQQLGVVSSGPPA